jgi:hypothetical protein
MSHNAAAQAQELARGLDLEHLRLGHLLERKPEVDEDPIAGHRWVVGEEAHVDAPDDTLDIDAAQVGQVGGELQDSARDTEAHRSILP